MAYFQINTNCLTGHYGPGVKRIAERLIEADLVDFALARVSEDRLDARGQTEQHGGRPTGRDGQHDSVTDSVLLDEHTDTGRKGSRKVLREILLGVESIERLLVTGEVDGHRVSRVTDRAEEALKERQAGLATIAKAKLDKHMVETSNT